MLGVPGDVFEDVHRLQRFAERLAIVEQPRVDAIVDGARVVVPQVGQQMPDRAGDVVAVLVELGHVARCGCRAGDSTTKPRIPRTISSIQRRKIACVRSSSLR